MKSIIGSLTVIVRWGKVSRLTVIYIGNCMRLLTDYADAMVHYVSYNF